MMSPPAPPQVTVTVALARANPAARAAAASSDYDQVKISEVARDSGVALGTLYRYFTSKEHLFAAVFVEWHGALKKKLEKERPEGETEADRLRDVFHRMIRAFQLQPQFFRVVMMLEATAAWDAAVAHGQDSGQFATAAAAAAVVAAPAAVDIGLDTVTLLGGIGYTWEHDTHLYWRRAMSLAAVLGPRGAWQRRVAELSLVTRRRHELRLKNEPSGLRPWPAETLAERAGLGQPTMVIGEWAVPTILAHGTDEQRAAFVGPTLRGELSWCQLFSEPGAGSDLASLATGAAKVDGGWRLNGQKAMREANGGYLFNEVFLTDVFVPDERLVGVPGDGWRLARITLGNERVNIATGSGQRAPLPSAQLAGLGHPVPAEVLAEAGALTANALAFTAMSQRLLLRQISGLPPGPEASVLKVVSAENAASARRAVLDWHGADSAVLAGPAHEYLSVPPQLIGGGTLEIQLNVISERVLGLPR